MSDKRIKWHVEKRAISELIPYTKNPRIITEQGLKHLKNSFDEIGFAQPININTDNTILSGHARVQQLKLDGETEVDVYVPDRKLTPKQEEAVIVRMNKNTAGQWDFDILANEFELDDLIEWGFTEDELGLPEVEKIDGLTDEDAVPDAPLEPATKRGDIWRLGNNRLMCGDSTMIDDVEKLMNGEKADMVFTDPPYGVDYKGINNDSRGGLELLLDQAFSNYLSTSKSGASVYVFHSDRCADIFHNCFRKYFHFSSMIIWNKNSLTLSQTDYQSKHEPCMYGWMNNGTHKFMGDRKQTSVWDIFKERVAGHTTPKPVELIEKALFNSSKGGDLVSDLFLGSGSTLIACEKNERKCYGMELDEKYCDVIINRWQDYTGKEAILESTGEKFNDLVKDEE